jgi:hypothetical protein
MCSGNSIPGKSTVFNGNKGISIAMMFLLGQETTAARGTDRQNISNLYVKGGLSRKLAERSIVLKCIDAYCAIFATMQAIRGPFTSIGE